ncbi:hypothetical protein V6N11_067665 [Hibiscus sabdariffa]|uniref:Uncharacterized protein n=1 Tax=Hibiscus sabdariffa TaxID=183260 RepID=A0ABR2SRF6_9ROSI
MQCKGLWHLFARHERLNGFSVYGYKLTVKKAYQNRRGGVRVKKDSSQSDDSSECSSSRVKKGDDVEHISLIAKEADNENGEEGVGQKARSWAEVLTVGEKNLGLSQLDGVEEEFKQFM